MHISEIIKKNFHEHLEVNKNSVNKLLPQIELATSKIISYRYCVSTNLVSCRILAEVFKWFILALAGFQSTSQQSDMVHATDAETHAERHAETHARRITFAHPYRPPR